MWKLNADSHVCTQPSQFTPDTSTFQLAGTLIPRGIDLNALLILIRTVGFTDTLCVQQQIAMRLELLVMTCK